MIGKYSDFQELRQILIVFIEPRAYGAPLMRGQQRHCRAWKVKAFLGPSQASRQGCGY